MNLSKLCAQLEALRRDEGCLAGENSLLRARLLAAEEAADASVRRHDEEKRGLEARVAELLFWKSRTVERHSTLEQARCQKFGVSPGRLVIEVHNKEKLALQGRLADFSGPDVASHEASLHASLHSYAWIKQGTWEAHV